MCSPTSLRYRPNSVLLPDQISAPGAVPDRLSSAPSTRFYKTAHQAAPSVLPDLPRSECFGAHIYSCATVVHLLLLTTRFPGSSFLPVPLSFLLGAAVPVPAPSGAMFLRPVCLLQPWRTPRHPDSGCPHVTFSAPTSAPSFCRFYAHLVLRCDLLCVLQITSFVHHPCTFPVFAPHSARDHILILPAIYNHQIHPSAADDVLFTVENL